MSFVLFEEKEHIGMLTINRPEALNSLNSKIIAELAGRLDEIAASALRCLIVTGAGVKSFVAGADIGEMKDMNEEQSAKFSAEGNAVMEKLENLPMPVIAAVNGYALGGGCEMALACDIRIIAENAVFALPEVGLGILPGYGGIQRLARVIGIAKAKELAFTANRIKAQEALALGLANELHPIGEAMNAAMKMAEKIASNAPAGVRAAKKVANGSIGLTLDKSTRLEIEPFSRCFSTQDQKQAMAAFVEKRTPGPFQGV